MIPKKPGIPGIVLELKYNGTVDQAINQIIEQDYVKAFDERVKKIYLVAINYDKGTKTHQCHIENVDKAGKTEQ